MDYLWTPWRYRYIAHEGEPAADCIFCAAAKPQADDHALLVVYRGRSNYIILNRFPYTSGHVMVVPNQHVATLSDLDGEALQEMFALAQQTEKRLRQVYRPDGFNLGMNIGKSAGAGISGHIHLHVLPRWYGDANFMTVAAETRVVPEDLETTWERLRGAFPKT